MGYSIQGNTDLFLIGKNISNKAVISGPEYNQYQCHIKNMFTIDQATIDSSQHIHERNGTIVVDENLYY